MSKMIHKRPTPDNYDFIHVKKCHPIVSTNPK